MTVPFQGRYDLAQIGLGHFLGMVPKLRHFLWGLTQVQGPFVVSRITLDGFALVRKVPDGDFCQTPDSGSVMGCGFRLHSFNQPELLVEVEDGDPEEGSALRKGPLDVDNAVTTSEKQIF